MNRASIEQLGPIRREVVAEQVAQRMLSLIQSGNLRPGQQLPPERELALALDVSRPSLREALRALSLLGVVRIRPGGGTFVTALEPDEILLEIRVPAMAPDAVGRYSRYLRTAAEHRPLVNVALVARRDGAVCHEARLAVGAATPIPSRLPRAEALLRGQTVTPELAAQVADAVAQDIDPVTDLRGSAEFRREMVRVVAQRTVGELFELKLDESSAI